MTPIRSERGQSLILVAVSMVAIMGMAAIAIDLGMLIKARGEAQRAADGAALGGASAFLLDQSAAAESTEAVHRANVVADTNYMNGVKFDTTSEVTVTVLTAEQKVRVKVRRAAVSTWFARVFGLNQFPVGAIAAAEASYGGGVSCTKPLAISDLWDDLDDLNGNHLPDPGEAQWLFDASDDTYEQANLTSDGSGTGLGSMLRDPVGRDWGLRVVLRPSVNGQGEPCPGDLQGGKCFMPGWWGLWGSNQTQELVDMMAGCDQTIRLVGDEESTTTGWRQPVSAAAGDLYDADAGARWDDSVWDPVVEKMGTVVGSSEGANWRYSSRVWTLAVFAPNAIPSQANAQIEFNNYMTFFFEGCANANGMGAIDGNCRTNTLIVGRFMGHATGAAGGPTTGTMVRVLRLVE